MEDGTMHYTTFEALPSSKKEIILKVCIEEFAEYGYENASTNRIVKKIKMSKGSLFKYFNTKEELYIYVIDHAVKAITTEMAADIRQLPINIFVRVYRLAEIEFDIYVKNPIVYKLFKQTFTGKSPIAQKLIEKYTIQAGSYFDYIFQDVACTDAKYDKEHIINLLKWVLTGYNEHFMEANFQKIKDIDKLKIEYLKGIQLYITIIRQGIDQAQC
jgi:TetR/AcrR family transcriptional regulator